MASWADVVAFWQPITSDRFEGSNDQEITFRVMSNLPVIVWDKEADKRRIVPMRWGFPDPKNWKIPKPIHARSEGIDTTKAFAGAFLDGQRGIVMVKTFNEAPDIPGPTIQHTITPGEQGTIGIAFIWRSFQIPVPPGTMDACVMVTVPANAPIATLPTDRMPAVLANEDWARQQPQTMQRCLKTVEGVRWRMTREEKATSPKLKRGKPTVSDPGGLL